MSDDLLSKKFVDDGESILSLNEQQKRPRTQVKEKIRHGEYEFSDISCPVCDNDEQFHRLSQKDRYGFYYPVKACCVCGLVQTNPRMTEESYGEFYNSEYRLLYSGIEEYAKSQFQSGMNRAERVHEYLKTTVPNRLDEADVLDIGCGSGGMLTYFQNNGHRVMGCDLDSDAVQYGREQGIPIQHVEATDLSLEWVPDVVILSHTVEHFLTPVETLQEIRALLGPDSLVYIEVPGIKWLSPFRS
jgi:SAM-dependent methyltransferase